MKLWEKLLNMPCTGYTFSDMKKQWGWPLEIHTYIDVSHFFINKQQSPIRCM